jgi:hypothetical protein
LSDTTWRKSGEYWRRIGESGCVSCVVGVVGKEERKEGEDSRDLSVLDIVRGGI